MAYRRIGLLVTVILLSLGAFTAVAQEEEEDPFPLEQIQQATVFLMQAYDTPNGQALSCVGSGTLISDSGLILTNAHIALANGPCIGERIIVALPVDVEDPPVPTYLAEVVDVSTRLDIGMLQITGGLDGGVIDPNNLNLPFVEVGNSSDLLPGNAITVAGYPSVGTTSVMTEERQIAQITRETSGLGTGAWFRIGEPVEGGISGGGAYDGEGRLIGIPTSAPNTDGTTASDSCLAIQDTTADRFITERDQCVPIGAAVRAIRPIQFAMPLIDAAQLSFQLDEKEGQFQPAPIDAPRIERVYVSTGLSSDRIPNQIVTQTPTGITSLYILFDYANMPTGAVYEVQVTRDGVEEPLLGLGPLMWGGQDAGVWYMGVEGITWPDGNYLVEIIVNQEPLANTRFQVGPGFDAQLFTNLTFGIPDANFNFQATGDLLPSEVQEVNAEFAYQGIVDGQLWQEIWYLEDEEIWNQIRNWDNGPSGVLRLNASNLEGLPLGDYRIDLFIDERLAATGDVTLAGNQSGDGSSQIFYNARIANDITRDELPSGQGGGTQPVGTQALYLFFNWDFLPPGTLWTYRWYLDGRLVASRTQTWDAGGIGENFWVSLQSNDPLPEGNYAVEVLVDNTPMFSQPVTIGSGRRPDEDLTVQEDDVFISGTVVDALTGEGIPGALVIVLDVALESPDFTWNESEILTQAITDRQGRFEFQQPVVRGNFYTTYVFAEDYITILEDNFTIPGDQESPVDIVIEMNKP